MKAKIIFCALAIAMLLCACQAEEPPETTNSRSSGAVRPQPIGEHTQQAASARPAGLRGGVYADRLFPAAL